MCWTLYCVLDEWNRPGPYGSWRNSLHLPQPHFSIWLRFLFSFLKSCFLASTWLLFDSSYISSDSFSIFYLFLIFLLPHQFLLSILGLVFFGLYSSCLNIFHIFNPPFSTQLQLHFFSCVQNISLGVLPFSSASSFSFWLINVSESPKLVSFIKQMVLEQHLYAKMGTC